MSPTVRCDPGVVNLDDPSLTIDAYKQLAAYAGARGIKVVVENHGPIAKDPEALVEILKAAGVGSLPDFGNFPDEDTRERGLRALFPLAGDLAHAKLREGQDFGRCVRIANESGFAGVFSCGTDLMSLWQSTQPNMVPWMEALNLSWFTERLTCLPSTSFVSSMRLRNRASCLV